LKTKIRIIVTVVISTILISFTTNQNQDASIIGTWISQEDNNYKLVFNGNTCTWIYSGQSNTTYSFSLSNTSPQCGEVVPVTSELNYLRLVNSSNSNETLCYEIYSLTETTLTLRPIEKSGFLIFNRQP
jgi:hypothetical protein